MTHAELVEAVAALRANRSFATTDGAPAWPELLTEQERQDEREDARAVIALIYERLREPTQPMDAAGFDAFGTDGSSKDIWRAMLAASPLYPGKEG